MVYTCPQSGNEAKFSAEYGVAASLIDKKITLSSYTDEMVKRPEIQELMKKVERKVFPGGHYSGLLTVEILYDDGSVFECSCKDFPGGFTCPLTEKHIREKFSECASYTIRQNQVERICEMLFAIKDISHIKDLLEVITDSIAE